jgi:hypothetical protein
LEPRTNIAATNLAAPPAYHGTNHVHCQCRTAFEGGGHFLFTTTGETPISGLLRMILIARRTASSSWLERPDR